VDGPVGDADRGRLGMGVFEIIEDER
jgi:hypothetical protein